MCLLEKDLGNQPGAKPRLNGDSSMEEAANTLLKGLEEIAEVINRLHTQLPLTVYRHNSAIGDAWRWRDGSQYSTGIGHDPD